MNTQCASILKHLQAGRTLSALSALRLFDCFRLAARVYDLRRRGHAIEREFIKVGDKTIATYFMGASK